MTLRLTVGFSSNPRIQPLMDGTVRPQNIDLDFALSYSGELFYRNLKYDEFDVSEMSMSSGLIAKERSDGTKWDWSGLPVFLSKAFSWLRLYVNTAAGIEHPRDLQGKRVGVPEYQVTAALWMRAVLKELYGIEPKDMIWYNGRPRELSHGGASGLTHDPPPGIALNWLREDQTLDVMLDQGDLDAAYFPRTSGPETRFSTALARYGGTPLTGNPRIRKLFTDGGREVISEYYRRTGVIPANHFVIVQNRILHEHPWVALELYKAFERAKEVAYERAKGSQSAYLLFEGKDFQEQSAIFGEDPYPLGIRANRRMLEILFQGSLEQGLIRKPVRIEEVFYPSTWDT